MKGFIILMIACLCQGSFGVGVKNYHPYLWENFRIPFVTLGMVVLPIALQSLLSDNWLPILLADKKVFCVVALCGILWGISAIWFDFAILKIGMTLTYGINFGISASLGSLLALPFSGREISSHKLALLIAATLVILAGILIITKAGMLETPPSFHKGTLFTGIMYAVGAGLGSAAMNIGFTYAAPIGELATGLGATPLAAKLLCWMPIFWAGCIPSYIYCILKFISNRSLHLYLEKGSVQAFLRSLSSSAAWFGALFFYAAAIAALGDDATAFSWIGFTSVALLISNLWGLRLGEWTDRKAKKLLILGNGILLVAFILSGIA